jgi:hypothetical protein
MTLSTGGFRQVVAFPPAPIATGWSDPCREGLAPSHELSLSTAHDDDPPTDLVMPAHPGAVPAESFSARAFSVGRLRPRAVQADGAGGQ